MNTRAMSYLADSRDIELPSGSRGVALRGIGLIRLVGVLVVPTGAAAV